MNYRYDGDFPADWPTHVDPPLRANLPARAGLPAPADPPAHREPPARAKPPAPAEHLARPGHSPPLFQCGLNPRDRPDPFRFRVACRAPSSCHLSDGKVHARNEAAHVDMHGLVVVFAQMSMT